MSSLDVLRLAASCCVWLSGCHPSTMLDKYESWHQHSWGHDGDHGADWIPLDISNDILAGFSSGTEKRIGFYLPGIREE